MWNGKMKAVTFSYDDGIEQDKRLVEMLNRYGLKCTFNLNSGVMTHESAWVNNGKAIHRMEPAEMKGLYDGHEIAVHCLTHANLAGLTEEELEQEVLKDRENLEALFGCKIHGMAYPYGTFDENIADFLARNGFSYGRTVWSRGETETPSGNLLMLRPTAHHNEDGLLAVIDSFVRLEEKDMDAPQMLYIWGHSYEFDVNGNWERLETICRMVSGHDDIFYGTNHEVLEPFYGH